MDTPEKNKIGTPVSKFEDSPIFSYINNLSPIKPVRSLHISQSFSSLSFAALPSVFTSPHINSNKESRFNRRYSISDPSKPELCFENGNRIRQCEDGAILDPAQQHGSSALVVNDGESSVDVHADSSKFEIELPRTLSFDCGSPVCIPSPCSVEEDFASELVDPLASLDPCVQGVAEKASSSGETRYHELCLSERRKEGVGCDWESLISDNADILIFNSPNGAEAFRGLAHSSLEPVTRICTSVTAEFTGGNVHSEHQMQMVDIVSSEQQVREELLLQTGDANQFSDFEPTQDILYHANSNPSIGSVPNEIDDTEAETFVAFSCKSVLSLHRGIRRRCLDFEMAGVRRKNTDDGSNSTSGLLSQQEEEIAADENQRSSLLRPCGSSMRRLLPGIGLHLNALTATTSKDSKVIRVPNTKISSSLHSPTAGPEALDKSSALASAEIDSNSLSENGVLLLQDGSQAPGSLAIEEFNQNSPKKKRRRTENGGEPDGCKRCNCKKSKCLKLYCECFAAGVYCIEPCSCQGCFNKPIHEDTVLATRKQIESRNPLAFAPKVIRSSDSAVPEYGQQDEPSKTPASARHKRGCNCKKSNCLKKYCECYQGGVGCSVGCRCEGCKNTFGRKDGSLSLVDVEAEQDEEELETCENTLTDKPSHNVEIHNTIEEQNPNSALPMTPLQIPRPLVPLPYSSKGKPPRSSFLTVASSSSGLYGQIHSRPSILRSQPSKFEKLTQTIRDDGEMPEILQGDGASPNTGIKSLSPNSKRISPPHCRLGSPGRRSGRKLILQSIPSFPSLTGHQ